jgi:peptide-methionine (S)-S-oxide reductase
MEQAMDRVTFAPRRIRQALAVVGLLAIVAWLLPVGRTSAETAQVLPAPVLDEAAGKTAPETAVFAGGCFWGVQGVFEHVKGVRQAVSGYAGGSAATAHYELTGTGTTGHAESVKVTFDPKVVTLGTLLQVFFSVAHDPTELNYQGPDSGTQYRSEIWTANDEQAAVARTYIAQLDRAHAFSQAIVTRVDPLKGFYPAEDYHQDYLILHPESMYIQINDLPKIANLKSLYPSLYRETPVMVAAAR